MATGLRNNLGMEKPDPLDSLDFSGSTALVLGSGWSGATKEIGSTVQEFSFRSLGLESLPLPGHRKHLSVVETPAGEQVLVFHSRVHLYEGFGVAPIRRMIEICKGAGVRKLVLTNGAGGIKNGWMAGTPVLISDHINLTGTTPLEGPSFVDLTDLYSKRLRDIARSVDPTLDEGVYVQFRGPQYETPAEVQMAKAMGGHVVGMSTALEAIAAREAGIEVLGLSLITNLAAGISPHALSHQEVIDAGRQAEPIISKLLANIVQEL